MGKLYTVGDLEREQEASAMRIAMAIAEAEKRKKKMKKCVVFDLDGTFVDNEHRRHFVTTKPKNWPAFVAAIPQDTVHEPVRDAMIALAEQYTILVFSGRGEETREVSQQQLEDAGVAHLVERMYMRRPEDNRRDDIVKEEILDQALDDGYDPQFFFDDRPQVVRMWKRKGYFVFDCNQPGEEF